MADKSDELMTREDRINQAKEYYGRGSRNYLVKDYAEAAEDFSRACELYAELYGENADELGLPHLYYAKALIALAQGGENKVLALQDEEEEGDDEGEAEAEAEAEAEPEQESNMAATMPAMQSFLHHRRKMAPHRWPMTPKMIPKISQAKRTEVK